jgi:hypothetical protein
MWFILYLNYSIYLGRLYNVELLLQEKRYVTDLHWE